VFWLWLMGCSSSILGPGEPLDVEIVDVRQTFQQAGENSVDLLIVSDRTQSMDDHPETLDELEPLVVGLTARLADWQIAVIGMDAQAPDFAELMGQPWIISKTTPDPVAAVTQAVLGPAATPPESGTRAVQRAFGLRFDENLGFFREDAALHVLFVSDIDDQSDHVELPADLLRSTLPSGTVFHAWTETGVCGGASAAIYRQLTRETGGLFVPVCEPNGSELAEDISGWAGEPARSFDLNFEPLPESVRVRVDGEPYPAEGIFESRLVLYDPPPPGAVIDVYYQTYRPLP